MTACGPHIRIRPEERAAQQLFGFKSAQYRLSGLVDLIHAPKARRLLDMVAAHPGGFQAGLWAGDEFVSADFGLREGAAPHPRIAAFNSAFGQDSPANLLQKQVIQPMGAKEL